MNFQEAYSEAYFEITDKGYNTQSCVDFKQGKYRGTVWLHKKATWKDKPRMVIKLKKFGSKYDIIKEEKQKFIEKYV
jgi:hypothetical protein